MHSPSPAQPTASGAPAAGCLDPQLAGRGPAHTRVGPLPGLPAAPGTAMRGAALHSPSPAPPTASGAPAAGCLDPHPAGRGQVHSRVGPLPAAPGTARRGAALHSPSPSADGSAASRQSPAAPSHGNSATDPLPAQGLGRAQSCLFPLHPQGNSASRMCSNSLPCCRNIAESPLLRRSLPQRARSGPGDVIARRQAGLSVRLRNERHRSFRSERRPKAE